MIKKIHIKATIRKNIEILEHVNADAEHQHEIEVEWASHVLFNSMVLDRDKKVSEKDKTS